MNNKQYQPPIRIFLLGFMATGKSTVGALLAQTLQYDFIDLDEYIATRCRKSIKTLISVHGETYFREQEAAALQEMSGFERVVVATGGGTPCFFDNMQFMNNKGCTVYLQTPPEVLYQRLKFQQAHRPLIAHLKGDELMNFIQNTLQQRQLYYQQAQIIIPYRTRNNIALCEEILNAL
ncbi:MAG: shikimate kinase [Sphingobacteriales bacterium]|nr:shikimate kinase [Sphingobacteriales bacterium]